MTVHNFLASLKKSEQHADASWWLDVYRAAFPTLKTHHSVREDGWAQRGGIDRVLVLECGRVVTVDEKVRERDYGDILLEYWSNKEREVRGWVCKPLACDFIAYAVAPTSTCYLLPTLTLRAAWRNNAENWVALGNSGRDGFKVCKAINNGYTTVSLAVPKDILLDAMKNAMIVSWSKEAA